MDGPGGTNALDIVIYENYDQLLPGHMGRGLFKAVDPHGDAPLRRYPGMTPTPRTTNGIRDSSSIFTNTPLARAQWSMSR